MEVLFALATKSAKHVGADAALGHGLSDGSHAVEVPLSGIAAFHLLEDMVASALYGQVYLLADIGITSHHSNGLVAHVFGMRACKSDAHLGGSLCYGLQQIRKVKWGSVRRCSLSSV